jgi:hypothetical protein
MVNVRKVMDLDQAGNFNPSEKITKGEAIATICRIQGIDENWAMDATPFVEMPPRHKYAKFVSGAEKAGMLDFAVKRGSLDVDGPLTNAELAVLLCKTEIGKKTLARLFDWETGYGTSVGKNNVVAITK